MRRNYYATTSYSDAQLLRLLGALDNHSLTNDTLIICFGDHGAHSSQYINALHVS